MNFDALDPTNPEILRQATPDAVHAADRWRSWRLEHPDVDAWSTAPAVLDAYSRGQVRKALENAAARVCSLCEGGVPLVFATNAPFHEQARGAQVRTFECDASQIHKLLRGA